MTTTEDYVKVDERNIGLDRAIIHREGIELPATPPQSSKDHRIDQDEDDKKKHSTLHRVRESIHEKKHDTAIKVKKTLHISKKSTTTADDELKKNQSVLANPVPRDSDSRLKEKLPTPAKATTKDFLHNPVENTKKMVQNRGNTEAAANMASREISHGQEVDLLRVHKRLQNADTAKEKEEATETFGELMKERQNMFVRWTMDRHVTKVRVSPKVTFEKKKMADFKRADPVGGVAVDWRAYGQHLLEYGVQQYGGQYIGYGMDHPTPSKKTIMPNIERLVIASAPFQEFIMTTRRVYRWENRSETLKYLIIYTLLWYMDLVFPGMLSAIVYLVVHRQYRPKTMEDLQQDIERTENRQQKALTLSEFIEKEGSDEWADKIIGAAGPWLMVQLADMANFFEVMRNFYEWRVPARTMATLSVMVVVIFVSAFVPAWLFIRALTFAAGVTFFGLFPISANFPEYRLLASLPKRLFWDIPTHAEWAVKAVQAEATRYQQTHASTASLSHDHDYGTYSAHWETQKGMLVVSQSSIRFVTNGNQVHWRIPYTQLNRVEKIDRIKDQKIPRLKPKSTTGEDLKIVARGADMGQASMREWVLKEVELRNQAFTQVVGFSGRPWQVAW